LLQVKPQEFSFIQTWQIMNPQSAQCQQKIPSAKQTEQVRSRIRLRRFRSSPVIVEF
jgi:hypothetical protein